MNKDVRIQDYNYDLPQERIALFPLAERDQSKLLVYSEGRVLHDHFFNLVDYLPEKSTLFFNNTKVIQARLHFRKESGAVIEVFLLHPVWPSSLMLLAMQSVGSCQWKCTIGNVKRWTSGLPLFAKGGDHILTAILKDREEGIVEFRWDAPLTFADIMNLFGETPLPPYLRRQPVGDDKTRYQTIYSEKEGAVAAPTAGLHFTDRVFESLRSKGIRHDFLTLHVSAGTFQPVKVENAAEHVMHNEQVVVTRDNILNLLNSKFTIPVGTTSMRTLESIYWYGVRLATERDSNFIISQQDAYTLRQDISLKDSLTNVVERMDRISTEALTGETSIFIMPGYKFRVCKGLVTNFHQPGSTLILLVAAFIGADWRKIYHDALSNGYRFLSYGDSSLLLPS